MAPSGHPSRSAATDGDPPVETSGAANREARQQGLVGQRAARQHSSEASLVGRQQPASSTLAHPEEWTADGFGGSGWMVGCLGAAPERGRQGVLFAGEYDDSGWGVSDGREAEAGLAHHPNRNRTTQMPHLGYRPTQPHHAILTTGHSLSTWCPREILGTGVFGQCFTHRKQASASDHSPKPLHRTTNPPTLPNSKFKYPNFGSSTVPHNKCT